MPDHGFLIEKCKDSQPKKKVEILFKRLGRKRKARFLMQVKAELPRWAIKFEILRENERGEFGKCSEVRLKTRKSSASNFHSFLFPTSLHGHRDRSDADIFIGHDFFLLAYLKCKKGEK